MTVCLPCVLKQFTIVVMLSLMLQVLTTVQLVDSTNNHFIHWNTTNPIFQISNTDHIIDVNKGNSQFEYDQATIICPTYDRTTREADAEKYIIYNVSREEYETCRITDPNPRIIAVCDKPYKLMFFTITFRSFTPQPGGLEFKPGQDYYFISTSADKDLLRRIGGRCTTNHMKVVFKVCCNETEKNTETAPIINPVPINNNRPISNDLNDHLHTSSRAPVGMSDSMYPTRGWRYTERGTPSTSRPAILHSFKGVHDLYDLHVPSINVKATTKVSDEYSKNNRHPNDIAVNEGFKSTSARAAPVSVPVTLALCTTLLLRLLTV